MSSKEVLVAERRMNVDLLATADAAKALREAERTLNLAQNDYTFAVDTSRDSTAAFIQLRNAEIDEELGKLVPR